MEEKNAVHFVSKDDLLQPLAAELKHLLEPRKDEPRIYRADCLQILGCHQAASFLPDGRINEECTCLHSALAHRCGYLMREAVRCFNASTVTPRGADCEEHFIRQARCVKKYGGLKD